MTVGRDRYLVHVVEVVTLAKRHRIKVREDTGRVSWWVRNRNGYGWHCADCHETPTYEVRIGWYD
jgi:hypothetical protein